MSVLLPLPFGPRRPVTSPGRTSTSKGASASLAPKRRVTPRATISPGPGLVPRATDVPGARWALPGRPAEGGGASRGTVRVLGRRGRGGARGRGRRCTAVERAPRRVRYRAVARIVQELKRDALGHVELVDAERPGATQLVVRRVAAAQAGLGLVARALAARERRALARLASEGGAEVRAGV